MLMVSHAAVEPWLKQELKTLLILRATVNDVAGADEAVFGLVKVQLSEGSLNAGVGTMDVSTDKVTALLIWRQA